MVINREQPMLVIEEGQLAGRKWVMDKDIFILGRDEDCDVALPERLVSRHHAAIRRKNGEYLLEDLGSKNGTFLNGQPVTRPAALQDGDEIQIALCFRLIFVGAGATIPLVFEKVQPNRGIRIDPNSHRVWVGDCELVPPLSPAQYRLLELLHDRDGAVCSREEIVRAVWLDEQEEGVSEQAIDALARRLRERLAKVDPDHSYIITVRGHGFRMEAQGE
ncbi:MAG: FHA domain-containing protein [Chloroflexota bacterium]|nr:FHA domain-containing protein [Chloroflexota bacterium]